jgi:orotidine-5'-phosphate decarboxylase
VKQLVQSVQNAGLKGVVCSPHELALFKGQDLYLVTPGIRSPVSPLDDKSKDDQKRTQTPYEALQAGASALVIGRPIVQAPDPRAAAMEISLAMVQAASVDSK